MADTKKSVLMVCDFQLGVADAAFAAQAINGAAAALKVARSNGMLVAFTKVTLRAGYPDVSSSNQVFEPVKQENLLPAAQSKLVPALQPLSGELLIDKDRFSAFSGSDLQDILRSQNINHLVMAGVETSGVVLSTFCAAADQDYSMTILSDACADKTASLHGELMSHLFPRSAQVVTVDTWSSHPNG